MCDLSADFVKRRLTEREGNENCNLPMLSRFIFVSDLPLIFISETIIYFSSKNCLVNFSGVSSRSKARRQYERMTFGIKARAQPDVGQM